MRARVAADLALGRTDQQYGRTDAASASILMAFRWPVSGGVKVLLNRVEVIANRITSVDAKESSFTLTPLPS